jgi:hypothetical protein
MQTSVAASLNSAWLAMEAENQEATAPWSFIGKVIEPYLLLALQKVRKPTSQR